MFHLPDRLKERKPFNISRRSTKFYDQNIFPLSGSDDPLFDLVDDMGDNLNRFPQILPFTFVLYNCFIISPVVKLLF